MFKTIDDNWPVSEWYNNEKAGEILKKTSHLTIRILGFQKATRDQNRPCYYGASFEHNEMF